MRETNQEFRIPVDGGSMPVHVPARSASGDLSGLVVIPSIFGPAPDLLENLETLRDAAVVVVTDPFWHARPGSIPYEDRDAAFARLRGFDLQRCYAETLTAIEWTRARCNGNVVALGICFGGPVVLHAAAEGKIAGAITWHGSRMENFLDRSGQISCPLRLCFGSDDPISPPDAIEKIRSAFAAHPDASFVVHPGLTHGYSHEGESFDAAALQSDLDTTRELLASL